MKIIVEVALEVNIEGDRVNGDEVFAAVDAAGLVFKEKLVGRIVETYQQRIVELLCSPTGRVAKRGLGSHEKKGGVGRCRCRTFKRAGHWAEERHLRGKDVEVTFYPAIIQCATCRRKLTPVLEALELEPHQRCSTILQQLAMEAVADTSYRRGVHQLEVLGEIPVTRSTMHRWAVSLEWPIRESEGKELLLSDGTRFKRQPGQRGEVRIVLEAGKNDGLRVLGVWAGTTWQEIGRQVKERLRGQPELFVGDGEQGLEMWVGQLAKEQQRSHWHFVRDSRVLLWHDGVKGQEAKDVMKRLTELLAIEIPGEDVEAVNESDKAALSRRIEVAEQELLQLQKGFEEKGYEKAAQYVDRAREHLFRHLRLWLTTGIIAPRSASLVENVIKELGRRIKKVGWNWSDRGAAKMGSMVLLRRYDPEEWEKYWRTRMNLQDRCKIRFTRFEAHVAA
jgi:hypothetical protein